jgi:hypothetical protein
MSFSPPATASLLKAEFSGELISRNSSTSPWTSSVRSPADRTQYPDRPGRQGTITINVEEGWDPLETVSAMGWTRELKATWSA